MLGDHRHKLWKPHAYQERATDFLLENARGALFADPGLGKTSIVLNAFSELLASGVAEKMLVVAPRRVCQLVWWQESRQWTQFRHLNFAWLHNSRAPWDIYGSPRKKEKELDKDADVYLINPEGVAWLWKTFYDHRKHKATGLPFDTVCADELTKFKNARAQRSKHLRKLTGSTPRLWGLTGSPTPNGYEDLFGQILLLDGGGALGQFYTHFRDKYFQAGYTGFDYVLKAGADKRIEAKIAPLVLRIAARDFLDLPEQIDQPIMIRLDDKSRKHYNKLKKEMLLEVEDGVITAANAAALYSKLAQLANGAVYLEQAFGEKREVVHVHNAKLDALGDLVEELGGAPLLVGYEFNHDIDRLKDWWLKHTGAELPYLGKGVTDRRVAEIERDWNAGKLPLLPCHPASTGHGLNLQRGGACHVCWFSATWDFELYDQFIQRVLRQGNEAAHVINHLLLVEDSIDELKYAALQDKDTTQARFLQAINTAFGKAPAAGEAAATAKENIVAVKKLGTKKDAETRPMPKGWGKPAKEAETAEGATEEQDASEEEEQRRTINKKLTGKAKKPAPEAEEEDEAPVNAKTAFSKDVQAQLDDEKEPPTTGQSVPQAATGTYRSVCVGIVFDADGNPTPQVTGNVSGDYTDEDADALVDQVAAMTNRLIEKLD